MARLTICLMLCLYLLVLPVAAQTGQAVAVNADARAILQGVTRVMEAGTDLAIGETVETDAMGQVQVLFSDNTELVIGPNSSLVLEDYLFRSDGSVGKLAINALSGTFRFATGTSPKDRYSIKTPSGTIGIRGTAFDFSIIDGITYLIVYHGTALLCGTGAECVEVSQSCQVGKSDGTTAQVVGLSMNASQDEREGLRAGFRYASNQSPLESGFRVDEVPLCQLAGQQKLLPTTLREVLAVCEPAIAQQYAGTTERWGECGTAVAAYVGQLDPNDPATSGVIAEIVVQLADLFKPGIDCLATPTELPDAIVLATLYATDAEQKVRVREIAETVRSCVQIQTAATPTLASP